jgi:adenylosuccinate lyase
MMEGVKIMNQEFHPLDAISSVDGRHRTDSEPVAEYFSEHAFHKYRVLVEVKYLTALSEEGVARRLTDEETRLLDDMWCAFSLEDAKTIQAMDRFGHDGKKPLNHDMKAVECFVRERLAGTSMKDMVEMVHFGITSEDVNNLALNIMVMDGLKKCYFPMVRSLCDRICDLARTEKATPMLARTHGQPASPTTLGKEMVVYLSRLSKEYCKGTELILEGKLNGSVGNFNSFVFTLPHVDWLSFSDRFVESFGFVANRFTTQIEPHDSLMHVFSFLVSVNNIVRDLANNLWHYISLGYFAQENVVGEVGSSVMPHKINPWRLERAEGLFYEANALLLMFMLKMQTSRLQRDLSDLEFARNIGTAVAMSYVALKSIIGEMGRLRADREAISRDLDAHDEVLAEGIQTLLRLEGVENAYDLVKETFRGGTDPDKYRRLLDFVKPHVSDRIGAMCPSNYVGLAERLAEIGICRYERMQK